MAEMALDRGLLIHSSCIWRCVQIYGPELDQRSRAHLKRTNKSYRVDEPTSGSKGGTDICTEPSIPQARPSISCSRPDAMLRQPSDSFVRHCSTQPIRSLALINVDKNRAYPVAVEELKVEGTLRRRCRLRQCKYLNNVVQQDHLVSKERVWLSRGNQSYSKAWRTLQGSEALHTIRKGRARWVGKGDPLAQRQFYRGTVWG